ncbi:MAG: hypothetical protein HUU25_07555 [Candidatus Sumerlaeia bacterium]|nr:hypothetical protein [Candidatus Sumerlaeia bacterium]
MRATTDGWGTLALTLGLLPLAGAQPSAPVGGGQLIDTVEIVAGRDASTRVWENVYEVPVLDAAGQPTGETEERRGQFVEVGTGLCYDARTPEEREAGAPPEWQPTDSDWVIAPGGGLSVETGPIAVRLGNNLTAPGHVQIGEGETALPLSVAGLAMQDTATGQLHLIEAPRNVEPEVEGNRVLYAGALTAGDIEYVYEPSGFKQNLILRNRAALPDPATLGMNPATTIVGLASLMDLEAQPHRLVAELASADLAAPSGVIAVAAGDAAADGSQLVEVAPLLAESGAEAVIAEAAPLRVVSDAGETVLTFRAGEAWDSTEGLPNASPVTESVSRVAGNTVLLDSVPYEWLLAAELPVTIDYQAFGGNQSPRNLTFVRGVTYYISSDLVVGSGQTLAIEPGAVVKLDGGTESIIVDHGGQIIAEGEPYDPIHFLRADYNTVNPSAPIGESVPGAGTGRSAAMIIINGNSTSASDRTNQSIIRHCRFSGGAGCISLVGNMNRADNPIFDCIFRDYFSAVSIITSSSGSQSQTQEIINCLFAPATPGTYEAQAYTGIEVSTRDADAVNVTALFCTFNGHHDSSVSVGTPAGQLSSNSTVNFDLQYNCLTSSSPSYGHLIDARAGTGLGGSASPYQYNAYDDTDSALFEGPLFPGPGSDAQTRGTFPTSGNGLFYQNGLMNHGTGVSGAGVAGLTTEAPVEVTGSITAVATWSPANSGVELDEGEDDIGYHYPVAHYWLSNTGHSVTADLTIAPGTVLSYGGAAAAITANTANARLTVDGGPGADELVRCYPHTSVGDAFDDVNRSNYLSAFTLGVNAPEDASIQGALILGANMGVRVEAMLPFRAVENCRFIDCLTGIYRESPFSESANTTQLDIRNNLFLRCASGITLSAGGGDEHTVFLRVEGNTFAHGGDLSSALHFREDGDIYLSRTLNFVWESNLVTRTGRVFSFHDDQQSATYDLNVVDRSNTYWMNQTDIEPGTIFEGVFFADDADLPGGAPGRHNHRQNPMNAHATSGAERRYDSGSGLWGTDGFFLAQAGGQASRHPLVLPSGWHLRDTDGITFDHIDDPYGSGTYRVYAGLAAPSALPGDFVNSSSQRLGHRTSADAYTGGSQSGNGVSRVWVALWHEGAAMGPPKEGEGGSGHLATFLAEDTRFTLHFTDAGESVEVGLPVALPDLDFWEPAPSGRGGWRWTGRCTTAIP